ncbi:ankyrin repeat-containing domain protein [Hypoxylon sp. FL1284]|nr:ankyrin repeat-containing domain protein [Hypoxylon sp. FL1284]
MPDIIEALPNELIIAICKSFGDDLASMNAFSVTNKRFHAVASEILYSFIASNTYILCWACETGNVHMVKKLLEFGLNPNLPAIGYEDEARRSRPAHPDVDITNPRNILGPVYGHVSWTEVPKFATEVSLARLATLHPSASGRDIVSFVQLSEMLYWFPLHCAAMAGSVEIIKLLVKFGAHIDPPSKSLCYCCPQTEYGFAARTNWTPLHTAICSLNEAAANSLLDLGASPIVEYSPAYNKPATALHWAALGGYVSIMRRILERKSGEISVDVPDHLGFTPLMWAMGTKNSVQTMECLLAHGADVEARTTTPSYYGREYQPTALLQACANGWHEDALFLVKSGARIDGGDSSALEMSLVLLGGLRSKKQNEYYGARETQRLSLQNTLEGKRPVLPPWPGITDLSEDSNYDGMIGFTQYLIHHGANIHGSANDKYPPLMRACAADLLPVVETLVSSGSDVNQEDALGGFPLVAAIIDWDRCVLGPSRKQHLDLYGTVDYLLKHGANPNKTNASGITALRAACAATKSTPDRLRVVKLLVDRGADIDLDVPNMDGMYLNRYVI